MPFAQWLEKNKGAGEDRRWCFGKTCGPDAAEPPPHTQAAKVINLCPLNSNRGQFLSMSWELVKNHNCAGGIKAVEQN